MQAKAEFNTQTFLEQLSYAARLTEDQAAAGGSVHHSVAVTAGAGAGKTGVLVARFMALLYHGARPEQIVAITFTRKAAAEMAERVQRELLYAAERDPRAREWLSELPQAQISTIHGLASRVLRRFPLQAGIDPAFRLMEEHESARLLRQCCRDALESWLVDQEELASLLYPTFDSEKYINSLIDLIQTLRNRGEDIEKLLARAAEAPPVSEPISFARYAAAIESYIPNIKSNATAVRQSAEKIAQLCAQLTASPDDFALMSELIEEIKGNTKKAERNKAAEQLMMFLDEQTPSETLLHRLSGSLDVFLHPLSQKVLNLLREILHRFQRGKEAEGYLDYSDLEEKAVAVLNRPQIAAALREEWRYFLIDEFQDVNRNQFQLALELCGQRLGEALFICGDAKQSIYGFRGAVVELFEEMSVRIRNLVPAEARGEIALQDNFRTLGSLLEVVNHVFIALMPGGYLPMRANRISLEEGGALEVLLNQGDKAADYRLNEAQAIARRVWNMVQNHEALIQETHEGVEARRGVLWGDIALLFRTRSDIALYEAALREMGIPTLQIGGHEFYSRPEILALRVLLQVLLRPDDHLSLWRWLTCPFIGLSPEKLSLAMLSTEASRLQFENLPLDGEDGFLRDRAMRQIRRWRRWLGMLPLDELLERIVAELWLPEFFALELQGEQALANVRKLIAIVRELIARDSSGLEALLSLFDELEELRVEGEQELYAADASSTENGGVPAVRLLTVHAAKGLEFPVVILPDLLRGGRVERIDQVLLYGTSGLVLPHSTAKAMAIQEERRQQGAAENLRLLYVALTRARDYLVLCGPEANAKARAGASCWWSLLQPILESLESHRVKTISGSDLPAFSEASGILEAQNEVGGLHTAREIESAIDSHRLASQLAEQSLIFTPGRAVATTALLNYQRCQRLYYLQSHLRLAPPHRHKRGDLHLEAKETVERAGIDDESAAQNSDTPVHDSVADRDEALRFGSLLHKLSEELCRRGNDALSETELSRMIVEGAPAYGYLARDLTELQHRALPLLQRLAHSALMREVCAAPKFYSELPFSYRLPSGLLLTGIIDLLVVNADGTLSLYDYKTNRVQSRFRQQLARQYSLQMHLYAAAAEAFIGLPVREAQLYLFYAPEGEELLSVIAEREDHRQLHLFSRAESLYQEEAVHQADIYARAISAGWRAHHFPLLPPGARLCRYCGYAPLCRRRPLLRRRGNEELGKKLYLRLPQKLRRF